MSFPPIAGWSPSTPESMIATVIPAPRDSSHVRSLRELNGLARRRPARTSGRKHSLQAGSSGASACASAASVIGGGGSARFRAGPGAHGARRHRGSRSRASGPRAWPTRRRTIASTNSQKRSSPGRSRVAAEIIASISSSSAETPSVSIIRRSSWASRARAPTWIATAAWWAKTEASSMSRIPNVPSRLSRTSRIPVVPEIAPHGDREDRSRDVAGPGGEVLAESGVPLRLGDGDRLAAREGVAGDPLPGRDLQPDDALALGAGGDHELELVRLRAGRGRSRRPPPRTG